MRLELGQPVHCADAAYGELADIVIDPLDKRVTHLVVQPHRDHVQAGLVPVDLVAADAGREIVLLCTVAELGDLPRVQQLEYLRMDTARVDDPDWDVGIENVLAMPYFASVDFDAVVPLDAPVEVSYDRVPKGEVEIQRKSSVFTADGHHLGSVDGFVVGPDGLISHVVLERGHLFGKREVTLPIGAVSRVQNDVVTLSLAKDEAERLPAVRMHRWPGEEG
jgi:sporulation protein YlmC with PRC-barrel domain